MSMSSIIRKMENDARAAVTEIVRAHRDRRPLNFQGRQVPSWIEEILKRELEGDTEIPGQLRAF